MVEISTNKYDWYQWEIKRSSHSIAWVFLDDLLFPECLVASLPGRTHFIAEGSAAVQIVNHFAASHHEPSGCMVQWVVFDVLVQFSAFGCVDRRGNYFDAPIFGSVVVITLKSVGFDLVQRRRYGTLPSLIGVLIARVMVGRRVETLDPRVDGLWVGLAISWVGWVHIETLIQSSWMFIASLIFQTLSKLDCTDGLEVVVHQSVWGCDLVLALSSGLESWRLRQHFALLVSTLLQQYEAHHAVDRVQNLMDLNCLRVRRGQILDLKMRLASILEVDEPK